jgi:Ger(x)C family germination protein
LKKITVIIISTFLLAGCWDQKQLKENRIVNGFSLDMGEDSDKILGAVRALNIRSAGGGKFEVQDEFYTSENETVSELETSLQNKVSGTMNVQKAFVIIIGEELAQSKGINSLIEPILRSNKGYISSRIAISEGKGNELLSLKIKESPIVFEIDNLLTGGTKESYIPKVTLFTAWNEISDQTTDVIIPYIKKDTEGNMMLAGSALFNGDKFTGHTLTTSQTSLLLLLRNQMDESAKLTINSEELSQSLTISINKASSNIKMSKKNGKVTCSITVNLKARLISYYEKNSPKNVNHLNRIASKELSKKTKELTDILIKANSDALGIAEELSTKYRESWNAESWKQEYQQVNIKPKVNVDILGTNQLQ